MLQKSKVKKDASLVISAAATLTRQEICLLWPGARE